MAIAVFALLVGVGLLVLLALGARRTHRARANGGAYGDVSWMAAVTSGSDGSSDCGSGADGGACDGGGGGGGGGE
jgi:hypothetical protein